MNINRVGAYGAFGVSAQYAIGSIVAVIFAVVCILLASLQMFFLPYRP